MPPLLEALLFSHSLVMLGLLAPTTFSFLPSVAQDMSCGSFPFAYCVLRAGQSLIIPAAPLCPAQGLGQSGCQGGLGMESSPVSAPSRSSVTVKGEV